MDALHVNHYPTTAENLEALLEAWIAHPIVSKSPAILDVKVKTGNVYTCVMAPKGEC